MKHSGLSLKAESLILKAESKKMFNDKITRTAFFVSILGHLLFLGMPGFNLDTPPVQKPEDINIVLRMEIPPLLPEIKVMGEEKKLKEIIEEEELPEPEPQPEPKPEPEPQPEEIVIEEPVPEPEPIVEPAIEPEPKEIVMDAPPEEPRKEHVEVIDPQKEAMLRYQDMIKQQIESRRRYPNWAKKQGFEGTAYLTFVVISCGQALDIKIVRPSGFSTLDNEAIATVRRASPFPPIPENLNSSRLDIEVAVVFMLN